MFKILQVELNKITLNWPSKVAPIFEENDDIVAAAKKEGETVLGDRREKVMLDLSKLMRKVEEFNECSDMEMMPQYVKDVMQVLSLSVSLPLSLSLSISLCLVLSLSLSLSPSLCVLSPPI